MSGADKLPMGGDSAAPDVEAGGGDSAAPGSTSRPAAAPPELQAAPPAAGGMPSPWSPPALQPTSPRSLALGPLAAGALPTFALLPRSASETSARSHQSGWSAAAASWQRDTAELIDAALELPPLPEEARRAVVGQALEAGEEALLQRIRFRWVCMCMSAWGKGRGGGRWARPAGPDCGLWQSKQERQPGRGAARIVVAVMRATRCWMPATTPKVRRGKNRANP
jgi:hypothetical protein